MFSACSASSAVKGSWIVLGSPRRTSVGSNRARRKPSGCRLRPSITMSTMFANVLSDLRFAVRGLRRSPLFAIVAILSLALGIGANSGHFHTHRPGAAAQLPVTRPDELVMLYQHGSTTGATWAIGCTRYPIYQDYQTRAEPLAEVLCRRLVPASVNIDNRTERCRRSWSSGTTSRCWA